MDASRLSSSSDNLSATTEELDIDRRPFAPLRISDRDRAFGRALMTELLVALGLIGPLPRLVFG